MNVVKRFGMNATERRPDWRATGSRPTRPATIGAVALTALLLAAGPVLAEEMKIPTAPGIMARHSASPVKLENLPAPKSFVTRHRIVIGGKPIDYRATAGETYISNIYGEPVARLFTFDYVKEGPVDPARPVLFIFNGGPGSSSVWLHMGIFGPKRVVLTPEINPASTPPFGVVDNPYSLLDVADLVFIDPVGAGFSQAVGNARDLDFARVDVDADSFSRFIELWLSKNGRWNSPKYIVGESYGTVRAAVLTRSLMGGPFYGGLMRGVTVDGVVLVGSAFGSRSPDSPAEDPLVSAARSLPSMAATAAYHGRIERGGRTAEQLYDEAKAFGEGAYLDALRAAKSGKADKKRAQSVAARLAALTGLPAETWLAADLVIPPSQYLKEILGDRGLQAGTYDSRYTLPLAGSGGDPVADDPAMGRYVPGFVAAFHMMLGDHLKVDMPITYTSIAFGELAFGWNYRRDGVKEGRSFASDLAIAMRRNPALRVMVASGYYDLATTAADAEGDIKDAGLPADRVVVHNYESGHMLYLGGTAPAFASDVRAFVTAGKRAGS